MKAIETVYAGVRFRSRLEARWAVFFDAARIRWSYESEGYEMEDGTRYLPDFVFVVVNKAYLNAGHSSVFGEVKPPGGDFAKAERFGLAANKWVFALEGEPGDSTPIVPRKNKPKHGGTVLSTCPARTLYFDITGTRNEEALYQAVAYARAYRFWDPPQGRTT